MKVLDFMSKNPIYIAPTSSVTDARAKMLKENISKLPVLDDSGRLVGLITKNDLNKAGPSEATTLDIYEIGYLLSKLKVEKIMTKKVYTVSCNEVVEEAARIMADHDIGCLPVMNGDVLVGIITETDLFLAFIEMFGTRHKGVRVSFEMSDKAGELAKLTDAIAKLGGNIVSVVTSDSEDASKRFCTVKIEHVSAADIEKIVQQTDVKISDIRES